MARDSNCLLHWTVGMLHWARDLVKFTITLDTATLPQERLIWGSEFIDKHLKMAERQKGFFEKPTKARLVRNDPERLTLDKSEE